MFIVRSLWKEKVYGVEVKAESGMSMAWRFSERMSMTWRSM